MNNAFIKKTITNINIIEWGAIAFHRLSALVVFFNNNRFFIINDLTPNPSPVQDIATTGCTISKVFFIDQYISNDPAQAGSFPFYVLPHLLKLPL